MAAISKIKVDSTTYDLANCYGNAFSTVKYGTLSSAPSTVYSTSAATVTTQTKFL